MNIIKKFSLLSMIFINFLQLDASFDPHDSSLSHDRNGYYQQPQFDQDNHYHRKNFPTSYEHNNAISVGDKSPIENKADELIERSYFSPEMQYAVYSYRYNNLFKINVFTGKVSNMPTVEEIIEGQLQDQGFPDPDTDAPTRLKALHAALEAVRLARFLAGLDVAYSQPEYLGFAPTISSKLLMPPIDPELIEVLHNKEKDVLYALKQTPGYNSVWSWIPTSIINMFSLKKDVSTLINQSSVRLNFTQQKIVTISDAMMKEIIKNFDYKQRINPKESADLLFKQCFIAQQILDNNDWPLYCKPAGSQISATNYIFDRFEIASNIYAQNIDILCTKIRTTANIQPHSPIQAHKLILQIRKAVQTAMFIANENSNFYIGYILPSSATQYLDKIVYELSLYDQKLAALCQDKKLGATNDDLVRSKVWDAISVIVTVGVVIGTAAILYNIGVTGTTALHDYANKFFAPAQPNQKKDTPDKSASKKILPATTNELKTTSPITQNEKNSDTNISQKNQLTSDYKQNPAMYSYEQLLGIIPNSGYKEYNKSNLINSDLKNDEENANETTLLDYLQESFNPDSIKSIGNALSAVIDTEVKTVPYWQGGGDAEIYGAPGLSDLDISQATGILGAGKAITKAATNWATKVPKAVMVGKNTPPQYTGPITKEAFLAKKATPPSDVYVGRPIHSKNQQLLLTASKDSTSNTASTRAIPKGIPTIATAGVLAGTPPDNDIASNAPGYTKKELKAMTPTGLIAQPQAPSAAPSAAPSELAAIIPAENSVAKPTDNYTASHVPLYAENEASSMEPGLLV